MRSLIEKRGVLVKPLHNHDDLRSVVQMWNEKNENLGEYSIVILIFDIVMIMIMMMLMMHDRHFGKNVLTFCQTR